MECVTPSRCSTSSSRRPAARSTRPRVRDLLGLADAEAVDRLVAALLAGDVVAGIAVLDELEDRGRDVGTVVGQVIDAIRADLSSSLGPDGDRARVAGLARVARRLAEIDPERRGVGGLRLQVELALFTSADGSAIPTTPAAAATMAPATPPPPAQPPVATEPTLAAGAAPEGNLQPEHPRIQSAEAPPKSISKAVVAEPKVAEPDVAESALEPPPGPPEPEAAEPAAAKRAATESEAAATEPAATKPATEPRRVAAQSQGHAAADQPSAVPGTRPPRGRAGPTSWPRSALPLARSSRSAGRWPSTATS